MKEKTVYVAVNGREFNSVEDCELYEKLIKLDEAADSLLRGAGVPAKKVAEYVEVICKWEYAKAKGPWPAGKVLFDKELFD